MKKEQASLKPLRKLYATAIKCLMNPVDNKKVPITILTGFLGSGKTTLLNRILKEQHGKKIAVIENEFGAVGVDDKLVIEEKHTGEAIIEVMNGCICCTVRKDLVETIKEMKKKYIDSGKIDYIIIETTGMADPRPILQTFLLNDEIQTFCKIDSCLTVCDSPSIVMRIEEEREEGCENEAVE
jgi:G3E family GTPase